jgi:hypothetical protein
MTDRWGQSFCTVVCANHRNDGPGRSSAACFGAPARPTRVLSRAFPPRVWDQLTPQVHISVCSVGSSAYREGHRRHLTSVPTTTATVQSRYSGGMFGPPAGSTRLLRRLFLCPVGPDRVVRYAYPGGQLGPVRTLIHVVRVKIAMVIRLQRAWRARRLVENEIYAYDLHE